MNRNLWRTIKAYFLNKPKTIEASQDSTSLRQTYYYVLTLTPPSQLQKSRVDYHPFNATKFKPGGSPSEVE
jgi:hypothetical protein